MKCRKCKREIADNSIFCNWCGHRQVTAADDVRVPKPRHKGKTWDAQVTVDGDRVYVSGKTEEEYYAKAKAAKTKLIRIKKAAPKIALGTVIDTYLKDNSNTLSPSTIKSYKSYRKSRFAQYMERDANTINYQQMVNEECAEKIKPKTVANAWRLVTASLRHYGIPAPVVNLPQVPKSERPWLDFSQIKTFCAAVHGKECELAALFALNGLRRSEILHLISDDIDTERGVIHVRGARVFSPSGEMVDKETNKNRTSTRDVFIVIPRITDLVRDKKGILITTHPNTLHSQINAICRANNLPSVGFHGLRHSYISLGFHLGVQDLIIATEVGHATVRTTQDIYRHLAAQDVSDEIKRMKDYFVVG